MRTARSLIMLAGCLALAGCAQDKAVITVDTAEQHQIMRGWEVTTDMTDDDHPDAVSLYRDKLYDMAIDEVGIDRIRLEVRSGAENNNRAWTRFSSGEITYQQWRPMRYPTVNDNNDPRTIEWAGFDFSELDENIDTIVLPLKRRIEARGERLFINMCYVAFTEQITAGLYQHDDPEEYAEFVLATYLHLRDKYGFTPDSWEVLLEPDNNIRQWNANLMGRAVVATAKRLRESGFTPAFVVPSTMDMANAAPWLDQIAQVPGAIEDVVEFSYHRYRNSTSENAGRIGEAGRRHNKPTAMLEWWFKNGNYRVLREDLVVANNSSWQGQVLRTLFDVDFANPKSPEVRVAPDTRLNRQYFRYVRFGATRVGAASTDPDNTRPSAFVNRDGSFVVVTDTVQSVELTFRGIPAGRYLVSYALESDETTAPREVASGANGELSVQMPGRGVVTVMSAVSKNGG